MAILTDLPNELLLSIIADVSPLYIESFLLTCKRIYRLRADVITAQKLARSSILSQNPDLRSDGFLRNIVEDPGLALYLVSWRIVTPYPWYDEGLQNCLLRSTPRSRKTSILLLWNL